MGAREREMKIKIPGGRGGGRGPRGDICNTRVGPTSFQ